MTVLWEAAAPALSGVILVGRRASAQEVAVALLRALRLTVTFSLSEFGVHLAELTVDPQGALAIRQVSPDQLVQSISNCPFANETSLWERARMRLICK